MLLGAGAIGSLALLLWPFLLSLSTAAVIAVLVYPAYEWCAERTHRPSLVSLLMTLGVIVLAQLLRLLRIGLPEAPPLPEGFGGYRQIGISLYPDYVLLVEITSLLLLAAIVGALILAKRKVD